MEKYLRILFLNLEYQLSGNFSTLVDFSLTGTQDKFIPNFESRILNLSFKKKYQEVLVLFYMRTQLKCRFLVCNLCVRPPGRNSFFLILWNLKRFKGKNLYHISYLPKGYKWTKIEKNRFFDFRRLM